MFFDLFFVLSELGTSSDNMTVVSLLSLLLCLVSLIGWVRHLVDSSLDSTSTNTSPVGSSTPVTPVTHVSDTPVSAVTPVSPVSAVSAVSTVSDTPVSDTVWDTVDPLPESDSCPDDCISPDPLPNSDSYPVSYPDSDVPLFSRWPYNKADVDPDPDYTDVCCAGAYPLPRRHIDSYPHPDDEEVSYSDDEVVSLDQQHADFVARELSRWFDRHGSLGPATVSDTPISVTTVSGDEVDRGSSGPATTVTTFTTVTTGTTITDVPHGTTVTPGVYPHSDAEVDSCSHAISLGLHTPLFADGLLSDDDDEGNPDSYPHPDDEVVTTATTVTTVATGTTVTSVTHVTTVTTGTSVTTGAWDTTVTHVNRVTTGTPGKGFERFKPVDASITVTPVSGSDSDNKGSKSPFSSRTYCTSSRLPVLRTSVYAQ